MQPNEEGSTATPTTANPSSQQQQHSSAASPVTITPPTVVTMTASAPVRRPTTVFGYCAFLDESQVAIPPLKVRRTLGLIRYQEGLLQRPPDICTKADCNPEACPGLHVDDAYLAALKDEARRGRPCCAYCGNTFSRALLLECPALQYLPPITVQGVSFPIERLSVTTGLARALPVATDIEPPQLCRNHLHGTCLRSKDCPNLHVCVLRWGSASPIGHQPISQQSSTQQYLSQQGSGASATSSASIGAKLPENQN